MILYKYRWRSNTFLFGIILMLGFYYDLLPLYKEVERYTESYKKVEQNLSLLKKLNYLNQNKKVKILSTPKLSDDEIGIIGALLNLLTRNNVDLQTITIEHISSGILLLKTNLHADFKQLFTLVELLRQFQYQIVINNFSYKVDRAFSIFTAEFILNKQIQTHEVNSPLPTNINNPFCLSDQLEIKDESLKMRISFKQMSLVAVLNKNQQQEAWLVLPNKNIVSVRKGSLIGKERAKVTEVLDDKLILVLPDAKKHTLKLQGGYV